MSSSLDGGESLKTWYVSQLGRMQLFFPKERAEVTDSLSAKLSKEHQQMFGHNIVLDVYFTLLDYTPCSDGSDEVKGSLL